MLTPRPITANPGQTIYISVQAETANVLVTLSGTGFTTVQGTTGANRSATIPVVMPSTAGTYQLYANATGYDRSLIAVIVSGATNLQLTIPSGTNRVQTVPIGSQGYVAGSV